VSWLAIAAGIAAESSGWALVARDRTSVWRSMPLVATFIGVLGLVWGDVMLHGSADLSASAWARSSSAWLGLALGVGTGVVLYLATRAFVSAIRDVEAFQRDTRTQYGRAAEVDARLAVALSAAVAVGEELFWRGLVQPELSRWFEGWLGAPQVVAALGAWVLFIFVNLWSRSLAIVAAAVVAGLVWSVLPVVTAGVVASVACHLVWTGLMLALPPAAGQVMMRA
jgi:membrane protease YdiL (CAAX protease family)